MKKIILFSSVTIVLTSASLKASCCDTVLGAIGSCICWTLSKLPTPDPNGRGIPISLTADTNDHSAWGQIAHENAAWERIREDVVHRIYQNKSLDALYVYFDRQCNVTRPGDLFVRFDVPYTHVEEAWTNYDFLLLAFRGSYTINGFAAYPIDETQNALKNYIQMHYGTAAKEHND